jgi:hypothetical protein
MNTSEVQIAPDSASHDARDVAAALAQVRGTASWLPWTGVALALLWWAAIGAAAFLWFGPEALLATPPAVLMTGALGALLPGLLLILACTVAAEASRSARANALVLRAAAQLLSPAGQIASESASLATTTRNTAEEVELAMGRALAAVRLVTRELAGELLRVENVSLSCADNARDLSTRLTEERRVLEGLARELRAQTVALSDAIPKQAEAMVLAAREAAIEVGQSEQALEERLLRLREGGQSLREAVASLDALVDGASARQDSLAREIARLDRNLADSRLLTERAVQASDMAAAAARDTGAALQQAVALAIEHAHAAAQTIHAETRASMDLTAEAIASLRAASLEAIETARSGLMPSPEDYPRTPSRKPPPVYKPLPPPHADDIFDDLAATPVDTPEPSPQPVSPPLPLIRLPESRLSETRMFDDVPPRPMPVAEPLTGGASLRDILSDIDRESAEPFAPDSGLELVERLQSSGIGLPRIFRSRDGRRLAQAARKGDEALRRTVREIAADEVERVAQRLSRDNALEGLARDFMRRDTSDILETLARLRADEATPPRVSAWLLVDAALNDTHARR